MHVLHSLPLLAMAVDCSAPPNEQDGVSRRAHVNVSLVSSHMLFAWCERAVSLTDTTCQSTNQELKRSFLFMTAGSSYTTPACASFFIETAVIGIIKHLAHFSAVNEFNLNLSYCVLFSGSYSVSCFGIQQCVKWL
jgi:hypothetical protein